MIFQNMAKIENESEERLDYDERHDYEDPKHRITLYGSFASHERRDVAVIEFKRILANLKKADDSKIPIEMPKPKR